MQFSPPLSLPSPQTHTFLSPTSVFSVRYGLDSRLVGVSHWLGTGSEGPGSIAGQTMHTVALLWYPLAVL